MAALDSTKVPEKEPSLTAALVLPLGVLIFVAAWHIGATMILERMKNGEQTAALQTASSLLADKLNSTAGHKGTQCALLADDHRLKKLIKRDFTTSLALRAALDKATLALDPQTVQDLKSLGYIE